MFRIRYLAILVVLSGGLLSCGENSTATTLGDITTILIDEGSGIDDRSFNAAAWRGITSFYGDTPSNPTKRNHFYKEIYASTADLRLPNAKLASDEEPDLIIATGFTFSSDIATVADLYPNQKYLIIDDNNVSRPNVREAIFAEHEGSFLVGVATAEKAINDSIENPKFGFIGGIPGSVITRFQIGFIQGILSVLPDAEIFDYYANDWGKPELAKVQAKAWFDQGVYAIFIAAGGTGNGAIAQAKEYRQAGKNIWIIGVDSDQYEDGIFQPYESVILTSMIKRVESPVIDTLTMVKEGLFVGGTVIYDLAKDGLDYSTKNRHLTSDIEVKVNEAKRRIINNEITVYSTLQSAVENNAVPSNLKAVD